MLLALGDRVPRVHPSCFVADSAQLIGSVELEDNASAWFNVVMRGDNEPILVGADANVQDGAVIHTDAGIVVRIGRGVTVGHQAMLHGCEVGEYSLIGIGAVVLNRAKVGRHCLVGARSLITEGKEIPDRSVVMGSPARVVKRVTDEQVALLEASAAHYVENARRFREELKAAAFESPAKGG